jgi:hypothetical protein
VEDRRSSRVLSLAIRVAVVVVLLAAAWAGRLPAAVVLAVAAHTNTAVGNSNTDCAQWMAGSTQTVSIGAGMGAARW